MTVLDLAEEVWETFPALLCSTEKWIYIAFMEISSKVGSQKAPELPLDLTLDNDNVCDFVHSSTCIYNRTMV